MLCYISINQLVNYILHACRSCEERQLPASENAYIKKIRHGSLHLNSIIYIIYTYLVINPNLSVSGIMLNKLRENTNALEK